MTCADTLGRFPCSSPVTLPVMDWLQLHQRIHALKHKQELRIRHEMKSARQLLITWQSTQGLVWLYEEQVVFESYDGEKKAEEKVAE